MEGYGLSLRTTAEDRELRAQKKTRAQGKGRCGSWQAGSGRQIAYTAENIELNFLSPYAILAGEHGRMFMTNTLTGNRVSLLGPDVRLRAFREAMNRGATEGELLDLLRALGYTEDCLYALMQEGLVE